MKKSMTLAAALTFCLFGFSACGAKTLSSEKSYAPIYRGAFGAYSEEVSDEKISIDGNITQEEYAGKKWYSCGYAEDTSNVYARHEITAFPSETGIYIAGKSYDNNIKNCDSFGSFAPDYNTGWELYFFCLKKGADQNEAQPTVIREQLMIDVNGNVVFATGLRGESAVKVDGEINSGETTGASFEVFIPYSELDIDVTEGIPEYVNILSEYRGFLPGSSTVTVMRLAQFPWIYTPAYYRFGINGYESADDENAVVGDQKSGFAKSANWDVSREREGIVESKGAQWQYIYFKDIYASDFIVTANVSLKGTLASCDDNPKAGLMLMDTSQKVYGFLLTDKYLESDGTMNGACVQSLVSSSWSISQLLDEKFTEAVASVKLTVVKKGAQIRLYVQNALISTLNVTEFTSDCYVGFYSQCANAVYSEYKADVFSTDEELNVLAAEYGVKI